MRRFIEKNFHSIRGRMLIGIGLIVVLISLIGATVSVYFMDRQALQSVNSFSNEISRYLVLLAVFLILGAMIVYVFSREINRPIARLVAGVEQFRAGNLQHRVDADGVGELSQLARAFNAMADELQHRTEALQRSEARHRLLIEDAQDGIFVVDSRSRFVKELRRAAELRELLLRTMSEGLMVVNVDEQIILVNQAAQAILDGKQEELKHKKLMECGWEFVTVDGAYLEYSKNPVIRALHERTRVMDCQLKIRRPASAALPGVEKDLQINTAPLCDERHNLLGALVTLRDITATRRDEQARTAMQEQMQQREKLASLGEMAASVAHEINNPVTGIINYAQLLLENDIGSEDDRALLRSIAQEGERIADIVRNLLTFARQEKQENTPTSLTNILDASLQLMGKGLQQDGITLIREVPEDLPRLYCRGQQIQQVFINLLSNARDALNQKYSEAHPHKILRIIAAAVERDGRKIVRTEFYDAGVGIAPEVLPKIFDPFFTTKDVNNGTGLGLSVAYGIVKDHQGEIYVESVPGEHTCFVVELPAATNGLS